MMPKQLLKILLVDDSQTQYSMVVDFLQVVTSPLIEYRIKWASNYDDGVELLEQDTYDVGLIDYELGDDNGLDFIAYVVQQQISLPMILFTGHGSFEVDLEAMRAGAVDYLDKTTLRPKTLERAIRYAIQNQQMLARERKQLAIMEALLDTALALNSSLEFDEVLERIISNMQGVIPHDAANVMLIDDENAGLVRYHGYSPEQTDGVYELLRNKVEKIPNYQKMLETQEPIIINHVSDNKEWVALKGSQPIESYLGIPIIIQDEVIGFLNFDGHKIDMFTEEHAHYAQLFAQQAAQAIRNTRAIQQARILAATQERQRLARDLHDAVSQTLFSASVIAQTLPRLVENNPEEVLNGLEDLNRLNRGALAEMRTLLVELRPQALIETDLPTLLRNLVHAFNSRAQAQVESRINYSQPLPEDVHIAFYRIAQEALNNVQKYAQADHVTIDMIQSNSHLELRIVDNGTGFEIDSVPPGHYGLEIMQERSIAINALWTIESTVGKGTSVQLKWHIKNGVHQNDE
jgi:signal transduction histidine kinase